MKLQSQIPAQARAERATQGVVGSVAPLELLLVEDSDSDANLFKALIKATKFLPAATVSRARSVAEARTLIQTRKPDCVLLDLGLPDSTGLSGLECLRDIDPGPAFLMLTGLDDEPTALASMRSGAQDYLVKDNADGNTLGRAILRSIQRHKIVSDITSQRRDANFASTHDALTGLGNRRLLEQRFAECCQEDETDRDLVMLDLDGFKVINDTYGHAVGDEVLKVVALRLRLSIRPGDLAVRLGGDEFVLLVDSNPMMRDGAVGIADRLLRVIEDPVQIGASAYQVSASIGVMRFPKGGGDPAAVLAECDRLMYADKQARRLR